MTMFRKNWASFAGIFTGMCLLVFALYACLSAWAQTETGLKITVTGPNQVSLTVTNGLTNGLYHIYFTEFLDDPDYEWTLLANGTTGQTNFTFLTYDYDQGFFKAISDSHFVAPSITLIIQSPTNGAVVN
jgi:hypothetical protein